MDKEEIQKRVDQAVKEYAQKQAEKNIYNELDKHDCQVGKQLLELTKYQREMIKKQEKEKLDLNQEIWKAKADNKKTSKIMFYIAVAFTLNFIFGLVSMIYIIK